MKVGDLVKVARYNYMGIIIEKDDSFYPTNYCILRNDNGKSSWHDKSDLEVICK